MRTFPQELLRRKSMKYQTYARSAKRASRLVERGNYEKALTVLRELLSSDISDVDKAMMCLNMAIVYDKMDRMEDALAWYDEGATYERPYKRHFVAEKKAVYLAEKGRYRDSLYAYERLLSRADLTEGDKERIERNIETLRRRVP
jgi:tetratricopeptide (TPR) repeat protein